MPATSVDSVLNLAYAAVVAFGRIMSMAISARPLRPSFRHDFAIVGIYVIACACLLDRMASEVIGHKNASLFDIIKARLSVGHFAECARLLRYVFAILSKHIGVKVGVCYYVDASILRLAEIGRAPCR